MEQVGMDQAERDGLLAHDADFGSGAVESAGETPQERLDDNMAKQLLPPWASSEPFGYEGSASDAQFVGADGVAEHEGDAEQAIADREIIGPDAG